MSFYDISRLSPAGPVRSTSRDQVADRSGTGARAPERDVDQGVAVQTQARVSAGPPPVDADRVAQIRTALRDGSYPILPARITDAMIAARLMLSNGQ